MYRQFGISLLMIVFVVSPGSGQSVDDAEKAILDLYDSGKLFKRADYKAVRGAFAQLFEATHDATIKTAYGDDYDALNKWFETRADLKQNFYIAIDEKNDDIVRALGIFKEIWKKYPESLDKWGNLAIAVAVVWDKPNKGVYDYVHHQRRTKSNLPDGRIDGIENYKFLVDSEKKLAHTTYLYPWEFLTFVVDHRTPIKEREWAFGYYQQAKGKAAKWHQDVPYDYDMLKGEQNKSSGSQPKLTGKDYTLPNILKFGGVCAQQADFAARTAKSLGVPAAYCWGKSAYRGLHAWWMYAHVTKATKDEITFTLVSDGRYEGFELDQFYTGNVTDPQTGLEILDRDLERRLWIAGSDRIGKRMANLLARAFPLIVEKRDLDSKGKVAYLDKTLKVNKHDEFAWQTLATIIERGELKADQRKLALSYVQSLGTTFANSPDFIARIFDPMLEVVPTSAEKLKLYDQEVGLFEKARRPDLACDARLRVTEILVADKKVDAAGNGLIGTIRKFPTEGRYVPKLTSKLNEIAPKYKSGVQQTGLLYLDLLPAMILHYRNATDDFYKGIEQQAKSFLRENNQAKVLADLEQRIALATAEVDKSRRDQ